MTKATTTAPDTGEEGRRVRLLQLSDAELGLVLDALEHEKTHLERQGFAPGGVRDRRHTALSGLENELLYQQTKGGTRRPPDGTPRDRWTPAPLPDLSDEVWEQVVRALGADHERVGGAGIDSYEELVEVVEEHAAITHFFDVAHQLRLRAEREGLRLVFHVFCDGPTDDFLEEPEEAVGLYLRHRAAGEPNVRLWYELRALDADGEDVPEEEDERFEENALIAWGGYPD